MAVDDGYDMHEAAGALADIVGDFVTAGFADLPAALQERLATGFDSGQLGIQVAVQMKPFRVCTYMVDSATGDPGLLFTYPPSGLKTMATPLAH